MNISSKGINYYGYLSTDQFSLTFSDPSTNVSVTTPEQMANGNFQIDITDISIFSHYGMYHWIAYMSRNNAQNSLFTGQADIAPTTGDLGSSNMDTMLNTPSRVIPGEYALSYGFYDAGTGLGGLTNQDESYAYLTDAYDSWMGNLAQEQSAVNNAPFSEFALVGAHDAGMYSAERVTSLLNMASYVGYLNSFLGGIVAGLAADQVLRIVINLAMTQKDSVTTQLDLGVRFFDFRPGYIVVPGLNLLDASLYHQHAVIPGVDYRSFLTDLLGWLSQHPTEIVVVNCNFQGFATQGMQPTPSVLATYLTNALTETGMTSLTIGDKGSLQSTYGSLISSNTRLIFLNQVGATNDAVKCDSYTKAAYETVNVASVLSALGDVTPTGPPPTGQQGADYTVLQLQGTATGTLAGQLGAALTYSDASSPLMSTKANFDHSTYPWVRTNVHKTGGLLDNQLMVFLNDFVDNALVSTAIGVTRMRMGLT